VRITKDPFEEVTVETRKAILWSLTAVLLLIIYGVAYPHQAGLVIMIFAFLALIIGHEFGHFVAAKRSGMKVTEFFVGFGPRVWSFQRGETEYGLKAFPLGGYCRIIGMTNLDEVAPEDEERAYRSRPWYLRVFVAFAGPAMNILIAIVLMFTVLFVAGDYKHERATLTLGAVTQGAKTAGLEPGDKLIAIDNTAVDSWDQVHALIAGPRNAPRRVGDPVQFVVRRGNEVLPQPITVYLSHNTDKNATAPVAGISPKAYLPHPGLLTALSQAPRQTADVGIDSFRALGKIFSPSGFVNYYRLLTGSKQANQNNRLISPVGYAQVSYDAVSAGWVAAVGLLLAINVFVALANLLPLYPLDGGHIAVALYEAAASKIRGRRVRVDAAKLLPIAVVVIGIVGFVGLAGLFLDITRPIANPF
jgi:membrane-associated protease RseP (regulator of RpoE activity)